MALLITATLLIATFTIAIPASAEEDTVKLTTPAPAVMASPTGETIVEPENAASPPRPYTRYYDYASPPHECG